MPPRLSVIVCVRVCARACARACGATAVRPIRCGPWADRAGGARLPAAEAL
jgi:hypothetical protein